MVAPQEGRRVNRQPCVSHRHRHRRVEHALAPENPPLLNVSHVRPFRAQTNWTNSFSKPYEFAQEDLADAGARDELQSEVSRPERLQPGEIRPTLSERSAKTVGKVHHSLPRQGPAP